MNIKTEPILRLRDHLLSSADRADLGAAPASGPSMASAARDAIVRRVEPFAETMFLVMMADGESTMAEQRALAAALGILTDGQIAPADIDAMLGRFRANLAHHGSEARLAQIGARLSGDREDCETAFTLAAVVALADDRVDLTENRMLEWVREHYGVSDRRVAVLLESID